MKHILFIALFSFGIVGFVLSKGTSGNPITMEVITRALLEDIKNRAEHCDYWEDDCIGPSMVLTSGDLSVGIVKIERNDTVYDVLIVMKGEKCITIKENPIVIRKKGESTVEYVLGFTYMNFDRKDTTCVKVCMGEMVPFKVDTLGYKFRHDMGKITNIDTFRFCRDSIKSEMSFAIPNNNDFSKYESWCEQYINTYEVKRYPGVEFPALMDVPRELNDYLMESARKGDFRLLKYAAIIALIIDAEVSKVSVTSTDLNGMGAENNGFVELLLKSSFKNFDEEGYFIIRVRTLGDFVRENSINLSKEDYDYVQEKFSAYLKRKLSRHRHRNSHR